MSTVFSETYSDLMDYSFGPQHVELCNQIQTKLELIGSPDRLSGASICQLTCEINNEEHRIMYPRKRGWGAGEKDVCVINDLAGGRMVELDFLVDLIRVLPNGGIKEWDKKIVINGYVIEKVFKLNGVEYGDARLIGNFTTLAAALFHTFMLNYGQNFLTVIEEAKDEMEGDEWKEVITKSGGLGLRNFRYFKPTELVDRIMTASKSEVNFTDYPAQHLRLSNRILTSSGEPTLTHAMTSVCKINIDSSIILEMERKGQLTIMDSIHSQREVNTLFFAIPVVDLEGIADEIDNGKYDHYILDRNSKRALTIEENLPTGLYYPNGKPIFLPSNATLGLHQISQ